MKIALLSRINRWFVFVMLTVVTIAVIISTVFFINYLRKEEIKRINLIFKAIKIQQEVESPDPAILELLPEIYSSNSTIPIVVTDKYHQPILEYGYSMNIAEEIANDPVALKQLIQRMSSSYEPLEIKFPDGNNQFIYYDNSRLLNNLRYSPYLLGLFIFSYLLFSFWFLRTIKKTDAGFLWAGLAKETAHQIGTPLSSMIGWIEIMRMENPYSAGISEIEKDVERLKTISERFSKIGSVPELNDMNLSETVQQNFDYLKTRISTKVAFTLQLPEEEMLISHNRILISWVIENVVKNAVDAMKGKGELNIHLYRKGKNIYIDFKDTGCGMTKRQAANVFKPGYSTKKRGWGLGLSLAKRVVNEYHDGDIKIAQTETGKGSVFRIVLKDRSDS